MKNINKASAFFLLSFICLLSACKKDISLNPLNFQTSDKTNEAQLTNQLAGIYSSLQAEQLYGWGLWGYFAAGNDEGFNSGLSVTNTTTQALTEAFRSSSDDASYLNLWKALYAGVERANILLSVINQPVMNESKRANIKGQALFLRAYYFYLLVNNFGDVPYKTTLTSNSGTSFDIPETPTKNIYDSIIKDMTAADSLVQTITQAQSTTTVTQTAVEGMLARVCLAAAGYPNNGGQPYYQMALNWAEKVIQRNVHSLNSSSHPQYPNTPAYARLFINNMQDNFVDKNLTEGMWDAAFLSNGVGSYAGLGYQATQQLGVIMGITCPSTSYRSTGAYRSYPTLVNLYGAGDLRKDWVTSTYTLDSNANKLLLGSKITINPGRTLKVRDTTFKDGVPIKINYDTTYFGSGATAVANVDINTGAVVSITITNGGSGYVSSPAPTLVTSFPSPGKNYKVGTIVINPTTGSILSIPVTTQGTGYVTSFDRPVAKWRREYEMNITKSTSVTSSNFPIIRYADVLLMAAEADLQVRGGGGTATATGVEYYNQVKRRAYGYDPKSVSPVDVSIVTMDSVMAERSRELCFEGVRRNDLKRWGLSVMINAMNNVKNAIGNSNAPTSSILASSLLGVNNFLSNPQKFSLYPIPSAELALEGALSQNPGW